MMVRDREASKDRRLVEYVVPYLRALTPIMFGLAALLLLVQPFSAVDKGLGERIGVWIFDGLAALFCLFTAFRGALGVGVFATDAELIVRSLYRTRRFPWLTLRAISTETGPVVLYMRTYLVLTFSSQATRRFRDINSRPPREGQPAPLDVVVEKLNRTLRNQSPP